MDTFNILKDATKEARQAFINRYIEIEKARLNNMIKKLEENGWDLKLVAPYPSSLISSSVSYRFAVEIRNNYTQYFKAVQCSRKISDPEIVILRDDAFDRVISHATKNATESFDAYLYKLAGKIGEPVSSAVLNGNLWQHSFLKVTLLSGEAQTWKTQMILNSSVYGKLFNQFPTRLIKA